MKRTLLMRIWLGPLPDWYGEFVRHMKTLEQFGFDTLVITDFDQVAAAFRQRLKLSIDPAAIAGTRKASDFCPALADLFPDQVAGYDYWGHVDLDVMLGRIDHYLAPVIDDGVDVWGGDPNAICGPLSIFKNAPHVNRLYRGTPRWRHVMTTPRHVGFDEIHFSATVRNAAAGGQLRFESDYQWSHDGEPEHTGGLPETPALQFMGDGTLIDIAKGREVIGYHFHKTRVWPSKIGFQPGELKPSDQLDAIDELLSEEQHG